MTWADILKYPEYKPTKPGHYLVVCDNRPEGTVVQWKFLFFNGDEFWTEQFTGEVTWFMRSLPPLPRDEENFPVLLNNP